MGLWDTELQSCPRVRMEMCQSQNKEKNDKILDSPFGEKIYIGIDHFGNMLF